MGDEARKTNPWTGLPGEHGGNVWAAARRTGLKPAEFLDFSASINPYGPPPRVFQAITENLSLLRFYPDPESFALREGLSAWRGVPPDYLLVGNGGAEIIYLLGRLLADRRAIILEPTFSEYQRALMAAGGHSIVHWPPAEDLWPLLEVLVDTVTAQDVIFWCNPNNPTGAYWNEKEMSPHLERLAEKGATIILDESFVDFAGQSVVSEAWPLIEAGRLLVLGSLTKIFALPGLRLGFLIASPAWCQRLQRLRDPWTVNVLAQVAGLAALQERGFVTETRHLIARERERLVGELAAHPHLKVFPSWANFLLLKLQDPHQTAPELREKLLTRGILIRAADNFPFLGPAYFRVAVRTPAENTRLLEAIKAALNPRT